MLKIEFLQKISKIYKLIYGYRGYEKSDKRSERNDASMSFLEKIWPRENTDSPIESDQCINSDAKSVDPDGITEVTKDLLTSILTPSIKDAEIEEKIGDIRRGLPLPVFWLLGKAQSGKSSIVQALTGCSEAVIGEGFQPRTRTAAIFDFPDPNTAFVQFLDTRGLGETGYDPAEDLAFCDKQAHLMIVTMKAMDHQQDAVLEAVRKVRKARPDMPIIVAQTCLHEGYSTMAHPEPYPFPGGAIGHGIPHRLALSLDVQRKACQDLNARFVALDFTQPDDGFDPHLYGLDALWDAIEADLPIGLRLLMERDGNRVDTIAGIYEQSAHPHIIGYAITTGLSAAVPFPGVSLPLVFAILGKLFQSIASIYGLPLTARTFSEISGAVGVGGLAGFGVRELTKLIPGWGSAVAGLSMAAITYALGKTLCFYYTKTLQGQAFTQETLRAVYKDEFKKGRELLRARFLSKKSGG